MSFKDAKKIYRSIPGKGFENPFLDQLIYELSLLGWQLDDFPCWKLSSLLKNRNRVSVIHYHWPEAFWRSESMLIQVLKCTQFIVCIYFARILGYKLAWSAHNVMPHLKVRSAFIERQMRKFVLRNFDLVVGHAKNTENELMKVFGTNGKEYITAVHGIYDRKTYPVITSREEKRKQFGIEGGATLFLLFGSSGGRLNKGEERFLREWVARESNGSKLLFKGHLPDNVKVGRYKDIITVEGFIPSRELGSIFNAIDFLVLPYEKITTSGMYFLALTFQTPIIAPNLHFFNLHSTDGQTSLLYDKNNYSESLNKVLNNAESSWCSNLEEFERLSSIYTWQQSANEISKAFDVLINES